MSNRIAKLACWGGLLVLFACSGGKGASEGEQLFRVRCARCHTVATPLSVRQDLAGWRRVVWVMRQRGAELTDGEAEKVARYLAEIRGL